MIVIAEINKKTIGLVMRANRFSSGNARNTTDRKTMIPNVAGDMSMIDRTIVCARTI